MNTPFYDGIPSGEPFRIYPNYTSANADLENLQVGTLVYINYYYYTNTNNANDTDALENNTAEAYLANKTIDNPNGKNYCFSLWKVGENENSGKTLIQIRQAEFYTKNTFEDLSDDLDEEKVLYFKGIDTDEDGQIDRYELNVISYEDLSAKVEPYLNYAGVKDSQDNNFFNGLDKADFQSEKIGKNFIAGSEITLKIPESTDQDTKNNFILGHNLKDIPEGTQGQYILGQYWNPPENTESERLITIGVGNGDDNRKNAFVMYKDGNSILYNDVLVWKNLTANSLNIYGLENIQGFRYNPSTSSSENISPLKLYIWDSDRTWENFTNYPRAEELFLSPWQWADNNERDYNTSNGATKVAKIDIPFDQPKKFKVISRRKTLNIRKENFTYTSADARIALRLSVGYLPWTFSSGLISDPSDIEQSSLWDQIKQMAYFSGFPDKTKIVEWVSRCFTLPKREGEANLTFGAFSVPYLGLEENQIIECWEEISGDITSEQRQSLLRYFKVIQEIIVSFFCVTNDTRKLAQPIPNSADARQILRYSVGLDPELEGDLPFNPATTNSKYIYSVNYIDLSEVHYIEGPGSQGVIKETDVNWYGFTLPETNDNFLILDVHRKNDPFNQYDSFYFRINNDTISTVEQKGDFYDIVGMGEIILIEPTL